MTFNIQNFYDMNYQLEKTFSITTAYVRDPDNCFFDNLKTDDEKYKMFEYEYSNCLFIRCCIQWKLIFAYLGSGKFKTEVIDISICDKYACGIALATERLCQTTRLVIFISRFNREFYINSGLYDNYVLLIASIKKLSNEMKFKKINSQNGTEVTLSCDCFKNSISEETFFIPEDMMRYESLIKQEDLNEAFDDITLDI